jgi:hypothetical protein
MVESIRYGGILSPLHGTTNTLLVIVADVVIAAWVATRSAVVEAPPVAERNGSSARRKRSPRPTQVD